METIRNMRNDMDKVLVERPRDRWGRFSVSAARGAILLSRGKLKNRFAKHDGANHQGMGRAYREKWFNENLRPLARFLRKNCGRPWNNIYSEMAEYLTPTSTVQRHVFVHLWQMVARTVVEKDGVLWIHDEWGPRRLDARYSVRWPQFYVCPKSGILKLYQVRKER